MESCAPVGHLTESEMEPGYYELQSKSGAKKELTKVYVAVKDDSISIVPLDQAGNGGAPQAMVPGQVIRKPSFDVDVLVVVFKYRPSSYDFPRQLTADFNGNVFLGYRVDRFKVERTKSPAGEVRKMAHRALSIGGFLGAGTTTINPWTTNYRTTDEYSGFVLTHGISLMAGFKSLTVGFGLGWDNLIDRDKDIWIYQNSVWYGLTLSLNLN